MNAITPPSMTGNRTSITCTTCGKAASVPFTPTPGRPVFCRDCFVRPAGGPGGPRGGSSYGEQREFVPRAPVPGARKRMLAQGRKGHFMYDAKEILRAKPGGMEDQHHRAFLEGLFARGARGSTEDAQVFLDEKLADNTISKEERDNLGRLLERYSFWR